MATEIIRWCDAHLFTDERVPGAAHTVQLDGKEGTVDLCPDHAKTLLGPVLDLLAPVKGEARKGRPVVPGPARCYLCDAAMGVDRMGPHLTKAHGVNLANVYGTTCPMCGVTLRSGQGIGTHAKTTHERSGLVDLWVFAEAEGDPLGMVAERRAAARE